MITHLFIWAVMAGSLTGSQHPANQHTPIWKGQWQYATKFDSPEYCHKAAANLRIKKEEYRCIVSDGSVR